METYDLMRHFMCDDLTLSLYMNGENPDFEEIEENLVVRAHVNRIQVPNHYYRAWGMYNNQNLRLSNPHNITDFFRLILPQFIDRYLEITDTDVVVKDKMFNEWQMVAREFSPATMKAFIAYKSHGGDDLDVLAHYLKSCFKATALPTTNNSFITSLAEEGGFYDDHIHAGSCLEADIVWLRMLHDAKYFLRQYKKGNPRNTYYHIQGICKNLGRVYSICKYAKRQIRKLYNEVGMNTDGSISLESEALLVINALKRIDKGDKMVAILLHKYLLSKGVVRNFLIVQQNQYGLEQFNKTLHTPFRGASFDYIEEALRQMAGNDSKGVEHVELRINPSQLKQVERLQTAARQLSDDNNNLFTRVSLVVHVIKKEEKGSYYHNCLRKELKKVVKDMEPHLSIHSKIKIAGIDVAGRDFLASPDVFTDFIHSLREKNESLHFTYHTGEDFFHILDGLRTIFEVVEFLKYGKNDRIGHASAAGVAPSLWADNLGGTIPMQQGMYLDDLIFACYFIENNNVEPLKKCVENIKAKIPDLVRKVYGGDYTFENLKDAWLMRSKSPEEFLHNPKDDKETLYYRYLKERTEYQKIIAVDCYEFFNEAELVILQKKIMEFLSENDITIETMPTSNVTIGHHHSFRSYHLATWMRWKNSQDKFPAIVLGTDETGVFPTNIKNEYANMYDLLVKAGDATEEDKVKIQSFVQDIFNMSKAKAFERPIIT